MLAQSGLMIVGGDKINKTSNVLSVRLSRSTRYMYYCKQAIEQSPSFYSMTTFLTFQVDFRTLTLLNVMTGLG